MLSVAEALARITAAFAPLPGETVGVGETNYQTGRRKFRWPFRLLGGLE